VARDDSTATPQSPETQDKEVREELDQDMITHEGERRKAPTGSLHTGPTGQHLGALEDEMVPIVPPMAGPADLVGEKDENAQGNEDGKTKPGEELFDPRDELTPG
jgi:hypothetical protein